MYRWIWSKLPGNRWLKLAQALGLLAVFVAVLFLGVFPQLDQWFIEPPTLVIE